MKRIRRSDEHITKNVRQLGKGRGEESNITRSRPKIIWKRQEETVNEDLNELGLDENLAGERKEAPYNF